MSRFRPRRYSSEPSDHSASFDIDDEGRLWLARATLHQLLRDTEEEGIPKAIAQSLGVKTVFASTRDGRSVTGADRERLLAALETRISSLQKKTRPGRLLRAARELGRTLGFTDDEMLVLAFVAACELHPEFRALERICDLRCHRDRVRLVAAAIDLGANHEKLLARKGRLVERGLLALSSGSADVCPFTLSRPLVPLFTEERPDGDAVVERLLSIGPPPRLTLTDFSHVGELPTLLHLLAGALIASVQPRATATKQTAQATRPQKTKATSKVGSPASRRRSGPSSAAVATAASRPQPLHILLHGPPGTGKSELARALAAAVGARLGEVSTEDEDGDSLHESGRTSALRLLDWVAHAQGGRFCILVDEAEDLLPTRSRSLLGGFLAGSVAEKGFYNELLERTHVPVIWTANTPDSLDEAHLRRFSLIVEMRAPPAERRAEIARRHAVDAGIDPDVLLELAQDVRLPLAMLQTVRSSVELARAGTSSTLAATLPPPPSDQTMARQISSGFLRLIDGRSPSRPRPTSLSFDPSLLNASIDLGGVVERLRRHPQATILLSGLPGTGKSAWARALAEALGRPLIACAPSELLSMYVGETEKKLAAAFSRAEAEGAVLLLDEADTFLLPRSTARHSWEVSQTNEMLVRVESFSGILVATTNATERMDEAIHRRFDLKVELRPLRLEQRVRLIKDLAQRQSLPTDDPSSGALLADAAGTLSGLCTGDVVAVERRLRFSPVTDLHGLIKALREETATRSTSRNRIGFGA